MNGMTPLSPWAFKCPNCGAEPELQCAPNQDNQHPVALICMERIRLAKITAKLDGEKFPFWD